LNKKILVGAISDNYCYLEIFRFDAMFSWQRLSPYFTDTPLTNRREKILNYRQKYNKYNVKTIK